MLNNFLVPKEFVSYFIVVFIGLVIDFTVLYLLITYTPIWYLYATAISFVLALTSNYILANSYVFSARKIASHHLAFVSFFAIGLSALFINQLSMYFFVEQISLAVLLSKLLTLPITFVWNFVLNKLFVFE